MKIQRKQEYIYIYIYIVNIQELLSENNWAKKPDG